MVIFYYTNQVLKKLSGCVKETTVVNLEFSHVNLIV